jgi:hypothetical protein
MKITTIVSTVGDVRTCAYCGRIIYFAHTHSHCPEPAVPPPAEIRPIGIDAAKDELIAGLARERELRAEVERLQNDLADCLDVRAGHGPTALASALAEIDMLRTALAYYANPAKWGNDRHTVFDYLRPHRHFRCSRDGCQVAKDALEGKEAKT